MRSKHSIVTATVAFSLFVLPAHASTPQEAPFVSDLIRCASLYIIASNLYGTETPEGQEAMTLAEEWFNRAKEKNNWADVNLPEDDMNTTVGRIVVDLLHLTTVGGYNDEPSSRPDVIQALRRDLAACKA